MVSTGQGILGNNMFAYCLCNPVNLLDPAGCRPQIWPTLFGEHNPGFIHNAVRDHIIASGLVEGEVYLPGIGRADIVDPDTKEMWEIKHGGSSPETQMTRTHDALSQLDRYISGAKEDLNRIFQIGHAGAFTGGFVLNCGDISYLVTYDTPEPGVILYYVQEMKEYEPAASFVYVPKTSQNMYLYGVGLASVGALAVYGRMSGGGCGLFDPLLKTC